MTPVKAYARATTLWSLLQLAPDGTMAADGEQLGTWYYTSDGWAGTVVLGDQSRQVEGKLAVHFRAAVAKALEELLLA